MNVIVISPHPDNETLGAGGSLLRHKDENDDIYWINITNIKEEYGYSSKLVKKRQREIEAVAKEYGFNDFLNLSLRPASLSNNDILNIISKVHSFIEKVKPEILYVPFYGDPHSDHRIVFDVLRPFFKSFRYPYIKKVLMMEIISETDNQFVKPFLPNVFVDISNYIDKKLEIMSIYESEIGEHPFPRSLENIKRLTMYRGSQCNCKFAESFMLLKEVL